MYPRNSSRTTAARACNYTGLQAGGAGSVLLVIATTVFQILHEPACCLVADADALTFVLQPRVDLYMAGQTTQARAYPAPARKRTCAKSCAHPISDAFSRR